MTTLEQFTFGKYEGIFINLLKDKIKYNYKERDIHDDMNEFYNQSPYNKLYDFTVYQIKFTFDEEDKFYYTACEILKDLGFNYYIYQPQYLSERGIIIPFDVLQTNDNSILEIHQLCKDLNSMLITKIKECVTFKDISILSNVMA